MPVRTEISTDRGCPYGRQLEAIEALQDEQSSAIFDQLTSESTESEPNTTTILQGALDNLTTAAARKSLSREALDRCINCHGDPENAQFLEGVCPVAALAIDRLFGER